MKIAFYMFMYVMVMSLGTSVGLPVMLKWIISSVFLVLIFLSVKNKEK